MRTSPCIGAIEQTQAAARVSATTSTTSAASHKPRRAPA